MYGKNMSIQFSDSGIFVENSSKETKTFSIRNGNKTIDGNVGAGMKVQLIGLDPDKPTTGISGPEIESCPTIEVFDFTKVKEVKPALIKKVSWLRQTIGSYLNNANNE